MCRPTFAPRSMGTVCASRRDRGAGGGIDRCGRPVECCSVVGDRTTRRTDAHQPDWLEIAICVATFMLLLDIMIVQVALPSVRNDLGGDLTGLQWTVDAYALALSALVLPFGVFADRFGRRRIFMFGLIGFSITSAACAVCTDADDSRRVPSTAGHHRRCAVPTVLALIAQEFPGQSRGPAIAAWGATTGAAVASGPIAGGLLTEYLNWRAIFIVNVPIGLRASC